MIYSKSLSGVVLVELNGIQNRMKGLKLLMRQNKALMSKREPVAQRQTDHSGHDRASIIHRFAGDGEERWERQENHTVNPPCQSQAVDRHTPFAQAPRTWCWESAFESSDDDQGGWDYVGRVEAKRGEGGSVAIVRMRSFARRYGW